MNSDVLNVLDLKEIPIFEQLQIEEALLRADTRNWCLINHGSPPAIVMGISSKVDDLIDLERWRERPIPLIRRFSGGGTVIIDEKSVFVTFICSTSFAKVPSFPQSIMRWTEPFYRPLFESNSFALRDNDYVLGDRKFGGNAQSIVKNRWLHHSSLLWDYDDIMMMLLKNPAKAPAYRKQREHKDFLCRLNEHWESPEAMKKAIKRQLHTQFNTCLIDHNEVQKILDIPHRKATRIETIVEKAVEHQHSE
jgi:lipoate---protein ligase